MPANLSPLIGDLKQYQLNWLPKDLIAGLSVAAVQVPTALAYAQLAGFSPEVGLYACILPVLVYAFFGSSRQLVIGADAATCTMVASLVAPMAQGNPGSYVALASGLSMVAGVLMLLGGVTGMGFIVNFFARPILVGFLNGVALSIIAGQMGKLFGIKLTQGDFIPSLLELVSHVGQTHVMTLLIGCATLTLLVLLQKLSPRLPSALIALGAATVGLQYLGGASTGVALVGHVPAGLPQFGLPHIGYHAGQGLLVSALGLVIVSFTSGMLTARSFAARTGSTIDANQEMRALGVANLCAGLSGSFAVTGADSRTAVNTACGNKTQLSSVFAAFATAAVALWLSAPLGLLPVPALAAVLIFSAVSLIDVATYKQLLRIDPFELRLSVITTIGVLSLGVLPGVAVSILLAIISLLVKMYKPNDTILGNVPGLDGVNDIGLSAESVTLPDILIWRFEGPVVFFNSEYFKNRALQVVSEIQPTPRWFVLSLESVSQIDATGLKSMEELNQELNKRDIKLLVARPKSYMRKLKERAGLADSFSDCDVFPTIRAALDAIATSSSDGSFASFYQAGKSAVDS